ncbi:MAG TPA: carbohydrate ABC transporter permease [Candidatus Limnocylindria bacterium]|nr:carbohydrate ABC transporter permease [Candidatus Limnocylindria bacterium]
MAAEPNVIGAPPIPVIEGAELTRPRRRVSRPSVRSFGVTFFAVVALAAFLSPMLRTVTMSLKTSEQIGASNAPLWPAEPRSFKWEGREYDVYQVPMPDGTVQELALITKGRQESEFIDPANPDAGVIVWQGSWRTLEGAWTFAPHWENFPKAWEGMNFPRLIFNTAMLAVIGTLGTLLSCVLVAYGFARFRFPGRNFLFLLLLSTIFLPAAVTLIPTYTIFVKLGWVGTWLPLLVPAFFANAYDVFLLRQYFLTLPRELDDAAKIDGAGPIRTLTSVIIPQSWAVIIAVAVFHVVYTWNLYFEPLLYLSSKPDLQPIATGLANFNSQRSQSVELVQAGTLMTMIIPLIVFILAQRFFMRGIVITGVEK